MDEAQALQQEKKEILSILQSAEINENNDSAAKFMIVEGRSNVYHKLVRMISATRKQITAITGVPGLIRADSLGLFDIGLENQFRTEIHFRFITDLSNQYADAMKNLLKRLTNARINSEGRAIDLDAKLFPRFFIRDDKEMILFVTSSGDTAVSEREDVALWTDSETLLHAFNVVFEKLWEKSIAIHVKLNEI